MAVVLDHQPKLAAAMSEFPVLEPAGTHGPGAPAGPPFASTLTGQDMARLSATGYRATGLALGASAWQALAFFGATLGGIPSWYNREVDSFSTALHYAQSQSRTRLADDAARLGGSGVVGVVLENHVMEFQTGSERVAGRIVEWVALGTAVTRADRQGPAFAAPRLVVSLNT